MSLLQTPRHARALARCVLCWFVLSIGVAIAAPIAQPASLNMVCSTAGSMKLVSSNDEGTPAAGSHSLRCVMCLALDAPPAIPVNTVPTSVLPAFVKTDLVSVHVTVRTAAPLAARGPPVSL